MSDRAKDVLIEMTAKALALHEEGRWLGMSEAEKDVYVDKAHAVFAVLGDVTEERALGEVESDGDFIISPFNEGDATWHRRVLIKVTPWMEEESNDAD